MTAEEYDLLESYFKLPNDPLKINYIEFNDDIERIFTEKGLEKDPLRKIEGFNAPSILDPKNIMTPEEDQALNDILVRMGTEVRHRRLLLMPFYKDKDRSNSGFISSARFRAIFDSMKMGMSDDEYQLIAKRFKAKAANEINYVEFNYVLKFYSGDHLPF